MYAISTLSVISTRTCAPAVLRACFVCVVSALIVTQVVLVGARIGARAETARILVRTDATLARIAELESHTMIHAQVPSTASALVAGFVTPTSFSYAVAHSLGSAASPNDL